MNVEQKIRKYREESHMPRSSRAFMSSPPREKLRTRQIECQSYAYEYGVDKREIDQWTWP